MWRLVESVDSCLPVVAHGLGMPGWDLLRHLASLVARAQGARAYRALDAARSRAARIGWAMSVMGFISRHRIG